MKRILEHIYKLRPRGGAETFSVSISRELQKLCDLTVAVTFDDSGDTLDKELQSFCKPVYLKKRGKVGFGSILRLRKLIKDNRPDGIHCENNTLIRTWLALLGMRKKPRVVYTFHLPAEKCASGFIRRLMFKHIMRKKWVYAVSLTNLMKLDVDKTLNPKNSFVVENGYDQTKFFNRVPYLSRPIDCVIFARLSAQKNLKLALDIFSAVKKTKPTAICKIYGEGPFLNELSAYAASVGLDPNEIFMGKTDNPSEIMNQSKLIMLTSIFEAMPMSFLEGMACGCIPVSTAVGGIADFVVDKQNGIFFEPNVPSKAVNVILDCISNPSAFVQMSENAMESVKAKTIEHSAKQYFALFE